MLIVICYARRVGPKHTALSLFCALCSLHCSQRSPRRALIQPPSTNLCFSTHFLLQLALPFWFLFFFSLIMQSRRTNGLSPLAIVLPHPPLPHRRSSLLSLNSAASPHTPRSCHSPCLPPVYYPANRKSTDSWNSSNADDMDFDWKPEQVLLLTRTLDALPAHLVTPFNGPIPPSNLLDKIARGVSQAKGPADWPHSIRATRVKLLELARARAKDDALAAQRRHVIAEEVEIDDGSNYSYFHDDEEKPLRNAGIGPRRPLYRQSSMDFIKPGPADLKDNPNIARLSNRLQRTDRTFPNPSYHPYSRIPRPTTTTSTTHRRSSSPPHPSDVPALINPSTPSSSTLNSFSSLSSSGVPRPRVLRRSASTLSSGSLFSTSSGGAGMPLHDPRLQRLRRSDSFCSGPPAPPPKDYPSTAGLKRAPSYGALAQEAKREAEVSAEQKHARRLSGSYPSSDEEEKARTKRAKKMRTRAGAGASAAVVVVVPPSSPSVASVPASSAPSSPMSMGCATVPSSPVSPAKDRDGVVVSPKVKAAKGAAVGCIEGVAIPKSPKSSGASKTRMSKPAATTALVYKAEGKTGKRDRAERENVRDGADKEKDKEKDRKEREKTDKDAVHSVQVVHRAVRMNAQRNPSMFGAELPTLRHAPPPPLVSSSGSMHMHTPPAKTKRMRSASPATGATPPPPRSLSLSLSPPPPAPSLIIPAPLLAHAPAFDLDPPSVRAPPSQPQPQPQHKRNDSTGSTSTTSGTNGTASPKAKTLRRVRRLAPARRISFGSLVAPAEAEGDVGGALAVDAEMECAEVPLRLGGGGGLAEGFGGGVGVSVADDYLHATTATISSSSSSALLCSTHPPPPPSILRALAASYTLHPAHAIRAVQTLPAPLPPLAYLSAAHRPSSLRHEVTRPQR
ncbi:hypothetical protein BDZ97DRAFT_2078037 [Flammula alnicola]|nr:hypothetical protein BDZ97DRAFT_2078037 [Flammula alnicola]